GMKLKPSITAGPVRLQLLLSSESDIDSDNPVKAPSFKLLIQINSGDSLLTLHSADGL
ncbi:hypothetical protein XENOCAPTIV_016943, partial [Xenoophorus captivus]